MNFSGIILIIIIILLIVVVPLWAWHFYSQWKIRQIIKSNHCKLHSTWYNTSSVGFQANGIKKSFRFIYKFSISCGDLNDFLFTQAVFSSTLLIHRKGHSNWISEGTLVLFKTSHNLFKAYVPVKFNC